MKIKITFLLMWLSSFTFAQKVNLGLEIGGGVGNTKVTNVKDYPDMFKSAAANGSLYGMTNINFNLNRFSIKLGIGVKGQPYQFNVENDYNVSEIEDYFGAQDLEKIAASYMVPLSVQYKFLNKKVSPFIGLGFTYESLFKDLRFDGVSVPEDFEYIKKNLVLADIQAGLLVKKSGKPFLEFIFAYEIGLNNLATDSYSFDGLTIRENDLQFGINWFFK